MKSFGMLGELPKWRLEELLAAVKAELRVRYTRHQPPKYGAINKGFTEAELERFWPCVTNRKAKLVFQLMACLGLRVSEACRLRKEDIDLSGRRVWVRSAKGSRPTMFFLHDAIYYPLREFLREERSDSPFLFPKTQAGNRHVYLSPNWVRAEFRKAVGAAGLDFCYAESTERHARPCRHLHRLTTHSLRHYFCRKCAIALNGDFRLLQQLSRHRDPKNVQRYCWVSQEETDQALEKVFSEE